MSYIGYLITTGFGSDSMNHNSLHTADGIFYASFDNLLHAVALYVQVFGKALQNSRNPSVVSK